MKRACPVVWWRVVARVIVVVGALASSGCYRSHGRPEIVEAPRDAAPDVLPPRDAELDARSPDAGPDGGASDGGSECVYACSADLAAAAHDCDGRVTVSSFDDRLTATVNMGGAVELAWTVTVCDPSGWVVHVADSPSSNGGGGDGFDFTNDAEIHLAEGTTLEVISNEHHPSGPSTRLETVTDYVPQAGCTTFTWTLGDQSFLSDRGPIEVVSPHLLRIDPPTDGEGDPDALWYVGLNRTHGSAGRAGIGARTARFCIR